MKRNDNIVASSNPLKDVISLVPEKGSVEIDRKFLDALSSRMYSGGILCETVDDTLKALRCLIDIEIFEIDINGPNLIKRGKHANQDK